MKIWHSKKLKISSQIFAHWANHHQHVLPLQNLYSLWFYTVHYVGLVISPPYHLYSSFSNIVVYHCGGQFALHNHSSLCFNMVFILQFYPSLLDSNLFSSNLHLNKSWIYYQFFCIQFESVLKEIRIGTFLSWFLSSFQKSFHQFYKCFI